MKKILLAAVLVALSSQAFALRNAPVAVCIYNGIPAGNGASLQEQLSYPGQGGLWSGVIPTDGHVCMHPYDWHSAPGIFDAYAVPHGLIRPFFYQCGAGMTNRNGIKSAPTQEEDYEFSQDSAGDYACRLM